MIDWTQLKTDLVFHKRESMKSTIIEGKKTKMENMKKKVKRINSSETSLVVQWLIIRLPMQGTRVQSLVREDPTYRRATKPVHNY